MTIEEKAKAYDELLAKAKQIYNKENDVLIMHTIEDLFPELKESEDEKIRKEITDLVMQPTWKTESEFHRRKELIAWLEKQGEQKPADKVEPKFKVGDWAVDKNGTVQQILSYKDCIYKHTNGYSSKMFEDEWRLWDITKDAKDGDVLCYKDEVFLYKHDIKNCTLKETSFGGMVYYCCYDGKRFITDSMYSLSEKDKDDIHPATKEQRDQLEKAIAVAGYEWDAEKKELKKIEYKPAWSEEHELHELKNKEL